MLKRIPHLLVAIAATLSTVATAAAETPSAVQILEQARATYAALSSYADTGELLLESGSNGQIQLTERHHFTTSYRAPRSFQFAFEKASGERLVVWCDGGDFQSWWSATRVHQTYAKGQGHQAFAAASYPTRGTVLQISPLLFSQAGLQGTLTGLTDPRLEGTETLGGSPAYRLAAEVGLSYAKTGAVTAVRPTTVWIDVATHLVRKVVEDTPTNAPGGIIDRLTTTFEPRANPTLADGAFRFDVP